MVTIFSGVSALPTNAALSKVACARSYAPNKSRSHAQVRDALLSDQSGATSIEYGLIAALVSVAIISAVQTLGTQVTATFNAVAKAVQGA